MVAAKGQTEPNKIALRCANRGKKGVYWRHHQKSTRSRTHGAGTGPPRPIMSCRTGAPTSQGPKLKHGTAAPAPWCSGAFGAVPPELVHWPTP